MTIDLTTNDHLLLTGHWIYSHQLLFIVVANLIAIYKLTVVLQ